MTVGYACRSLNGHNDAASVPVLSPDDQFCHSGSWDMTMRQRDVYSGVSVCILEEHTKEVDNAAFFSDNSLNPQQPRLSAPATSRSSCATRTMCAEAAEEVTMSTELESPLFATIDAI